MSKRRSSHGRRLRTIAGLMALLPLVLFFVAGGDVHARNQSRVRTIDKDKLKSMLGSPGVTVLDVRSGLDWEDSKYKVKGAVRENPASVGDWTGDLPKKDTYVLYCD